MTRKAPLKSPEPSASPVEEFAAVTLAGMAMSSVEPPMITSHVARPSPLAFGPGLERFVGESAELAHHVEKLSAKVSFTVCPVTRSRAPLRAMRGRLRDADPNAFRPDENAASDAVQRMIARGFKIVRVGRFGITVEGTADQVQQELRIRLGVQAKPRREGSRAVLNFAESLRAPAAVDLFIAPLQSLTAPSAEPTIDSFNFIPPPLLYSPSPVPPVPAYHHIDEAAIRSLLRVPHASTGKGVRVGMVDTGFFNHPYYANKGYVYKPTPSPGAEDADVDENGHGTAMAMNVFAVAPEAELLGLKLSGTPQDQIEQAAELGAKIITCSWGFDFEQSFQNIELSIKSVIQDDGCIVIVASGNGQHSWPGTMPQVISVGGVFADSAGRFTASNYASGFISSLYANRRVPDVCGLCGESPKAIYIPMPCPPGCELDREFSNGAQFPDGDMTPTDDGWLVASGTSSATPQVAGVVALMLERAAAKGRTLSTDDVRNILERSAIPVLAGQNAFGFPADIGVPSTAVGFGLVDAGAALALV